MKPRSPVRKCGANVAVLPRIMSADGSNTASGTVRLPLCCASGQRAIAETPIVLPPSPYDFGELPIAASDGISRHPNLPDGAWLQRSRGARVDDPHDLCYWSATWQQITPGNLKPVRLRRRMIPWGDCAGYYLVVIGSHLTAWHGPIANAEAVSRHTKNMGRLCSPAYEQAVLRQTEDAREGTRIEPYASKLGNKGAQRIDSDWLCSVHRDQPVVKRERSKLRIIHSTDA
eukprot:scaffold122179_cov27-Tisochrysis_lutea.AAC.6